MTNEQFNDLLRLIQTVAIAEREIARFHPADHRQEKERIEKYEEDVDHLRMLMVDGGGDD